MTYLLNNREVEIEEVDGEIGEGAYVVSASYVDTGVPCDDDECEKLNDIYQEELYDRLYQQAIMKSEAWADSLEDR